MDSPAKLNCSTTDGEISTDDEEKSNFRPRLHWTAEHNRSGDTGHPTTPSPPFTRTFVGPRMKRERSYLRGQSDVGRHGDQEHQPITARRFSIASSANNERGNEAPRPRKKIRAPDEETKKLHFNRATKSGHGHANKRRHHDWDGNRELVQRSSRNREEFERHGKRDAEWRSRRRSRSPDRKRNHERGRRRSSREGEDVVRKKKQEKFDRKHQFVSSRPIRGEKRDGQKIYGKHEARESNGQEPKGPHKRIRHQYDDLTNIFQFSNNRLHTPEKEYKKHEKEIVSLDRVRDVLGGHKNRDTNIRRQTLAPRKIRDENASEIVRPILKKCLENVFRGLFDTPNLACPNLEGENKIETVISQRDIKEEEDESLATATDELLVLMNVGEESRDISSSTSIPEKKREIALSYGVPSTALAREDGFVKMAITFVGRMQQMSKITERTGCKIAYLMIERWKEAGETFDTLTTKYESAMASDFEYDPSLMKLRRQLHACLKAKGNGSELFTYSELVDLTVFFFNFISSLEF